MPYVKRRATIFLIVTALAIFALTSLMIILMARPAWSHGMTDVGLPAGITCELVREKVAEHGKAAAIAWAIRQGYSLAQIRQAQRCLK
jgi:hypothetical protein